jgi:hypothetical protein
MRQKLNKSIACGQRRTWLINAKPRHGVLVREARKWPWDVHTHASAPHLSHNVLDDRLDLVLGRERRLKVCTVHLANPSQVNGNVFVCQASQINPCVMWLWPMCDVALANV